MALTESEGLMPNKNLNSTILASAWESASTDFQQLVPPPSQSRMSEVIAAFEMPNAGRLFQEVTGLFTTIGVTRIKTQRFENPLAFLESSFMSYGANVREMGIKWTRAHSYASDSQALLKRHLPKFVEAFHQIDRLDKYPQTVSRTEFIQSLQPGIGGEDGTGLDTLLGGVFDSMYSPEAYDSMRYTLQTIAEADNSWGEINGRGQYGLMRVNVPEIVDKDTGEQFMQTLESLALRWRFPSTIYNNVPDLPVFTDPEDLVIMVTPETLAAIDFRTIANLFHEERAEDVRRRIVVVPDFPIPNVRAVLADRNFFVIHRTFFSLESFYNPDQVTTNYWLHSQGVWSASPLANIVLLGDFEDTEIPTITVEPASLTLTPAFNEVAMGKQVLIRAELSGSVSVTPEGASTGSICVKPNAVTWEIEAPEGVSLNRRTYIDRFGNLHVQKSGIEAGTALTITGTSTYINPSGETTELTATATVTVVEDEPCKHTCKDQLAYTDIRNAELKDNAIEGTNDAPVNP